MTVSLPAKEFIAKKRDGGEHSAEELRAWLNGYLSGEVHDYQMAAWLMAVYFRGMTPAETSAWTRLKWKSGYTFPRETRADYWIDKHSTGGVGDKTSLILVPLVTSVCRRLFGAGKVKIPMVSGRGLGHSGGTLDKLESVPGFSPRLTTGRALELLGGNDYFMMGQTEDIAPADRLLYALRDVIATVESRPLIVSSILSKKLSENLDGLVLDIKVGSGAFMKTTGEARALAQALLDSARAQGLEAVALFTRMDEPLGYKVGNHLEVEECADFLTGKTRERGLFEVTLTLAAWMVHLASRRRIGLETARAECESELSSSSPFGIFKAMFRAQGGDWDGFEKESDLLRRELRAYLWKAPRAGRIKEIKALPVGILVNSLGGGRLTKDKGIDPLVGIELFRKAGDTVELGEAVLKVYHRHERDEAAIERGLAEAVVIEPVLEREVGGVGLPETDSGEAVNWVLGHLS